MEKCPFDNIPLKKLLLQSFCPIIAHFHVTQKFSPSVQGKYWFFWVTYEKKIPYLIVNYCIFNFSGQRSEEQRKKNRNSKLLRGFGNMFKIGKDSSNSNSNNNNQANVERTKDTKVLRKSCPGKKKCFIIQLRKCFFQNK